MAWRIHLLGKIEAMREERTLSHFESSRVVALLARLALYPRRVHPREELVELLWPETETEVARGRLRHTLLVLRRQLEAGLPPGTVLVADRQSVRLNPETFVTDVAEFEQAVGSGDHATACRLYAGELLPGLWDDWIVAERHRLEALADGLPDLSEDAPPTPVPPPALPPGGAGIPRPTAPAYLTAFIGRERERSDVAALLRRHRLVTLTGMGGMGKTRLAAEVFRQVAPEFAHAAFVSLAECAVASQIPGRVRAALALPPAEGADPLEQLSLGLGDRPTLLVLDNLEHLVESGGAIVIETLLARLPGLACLVTTRRALLAVSGERLYPLDPLPEASGTALFLDRAQAVRPGYRLTEGNRADVAAVCRGLEGIPLALELAASRLRAFSVAEMRRELQRRFDWLARRGIQGDKDDRHRSLAATLEWSWHLLSPSQRAFLTALSLFRGHWSAADAAGITDAHDAHDARDRLESLVTDSWLASESNEADSGEMRFSMLETVRDFVAPRLEKAPEARRRYRKHFLSHPPRDQNAVAAWEYALEDGDAGHAYALAENGYPEWTALTGVPRALSLLETTRTLPAPEPRLRLHAGHQMAILLQRANDRAGGIACMDETLVEMEGAPADVRAEAWMMRARTGMYDEPGAQTLARLDRCLALAADPLIRAEAMRCKGVVLTRTRAYAEARALFDAAEALYPPGHRGLRLLLLHRAVSWHEQQDWDRALALYRACVDASLAADDPMLRSLCLQNLIDVLAYRGDWQEAVRTGRGCLETAERLGDRHAVINVLWNLARPLLLAGDAPAAARTMGFASAFWERAVRPLTPDEIRERDALRAEIAAAMGSAPACARFWDEGAGRTLNEALAAALSPD